MLFTIGTCIKKKPLATKIKTPSKKSWQYGKYLCMKIILQNLKYQVKNVDNVRKYLPIAVHVAKSY